MVREELGEYLTFDSVRTVLLYCPKQPDAAENIEVLQKTFINRKNMYHALFTTMDRGGIVSILVFDRANGERVFEDFSETLGKTLKGIHMIWGMVYALEKDLSLIHISLW